MKIVALLLLTFCLHVSAKTYSQTVTLSGKDMQLRKVFEAIKKQTGYVLFANRSLLANTNPVTLSVYDMPLQDLLDVVMRDQPMNFRIEDHTIILSEKNTLTIAAPAPQYTVVAGLVIKQDGQPLPSASVRVRGASGGAHTDENGRFRLTNVPEDGTLIISSVGYHTVIVPLEEFKTKTQISGMAYKGGRTGDALNIEVTMKQLVDSLKDIEVTSFSTGYYEVPKERATGSFTQIDNKQFNRATGGNVLTRLEGITNGMLFSRNKLTKENLSGQPEIRIRGLSTILGNIQPLIVVDNFPFEGDINSLNPNDVESITILRDAAAASIWGARAGNGVIVINTKTGRYNQPVRVSVNSNVTIGEKPDLYYSRDYLPAATVMEIQKDLFLKGSYIQLNQQRIPLYPELLFAQKAGTISQQDFDKQEAWFRSNDLRDDWNKYLYRTSVTQQHSASVRGGGNAYRYSFGAGFDKNRDSYVGNEGSRISLNLQNTFKVRSNLELTGTVWYARRHSTSNAIFSSVSNTFNQVSPDIYESLIDMNGNHNALNLQNNRFKYQAEIMNSNTATVKRVDWLMRPLDEVVLNNAQTDYSDWRLNGGLKYRFLQYFSLDVTYQYILSQTEKSTYHDPASYFVRDLVNRFTQTTGTRVIPLGGIMEFPPSDKTISQSARALLSYSQQYDDNHSVSAIAGIEGRQSVNANKPGVTLYNYNPDLLTFNGGLDFATSYPVIPQGTGRVPTTATYVLTNKTNRDLSYFGNASYTWKEKYILSGSLRWDGSNLLGVRANQRGTALWSAGLSWDLSKEPFYQIEKQLPYLRLRATYGSAGNIDRTQTHYPTIMFSTNTNTNQIQADLRTAGNPSLRWEQVNTMNFGMDFKAFNNRISGSVEFYNKAAKYLLGSNTVDPTTGVPSNFKLNYAAMRTWGWDIQINSRNLQIGKFNWGSTLLFNTSRNRITKLKENPPTADNQYLTTTIYEQGASVDKLYAIPWNGLNPNDGSVLIYDKSGTIRTDYQAYYNALKKADLVVAGVTVPPVTTSLMNTFEWNGITVSALLVGRFGSVFRRTSMYPTAEYTNTLTNSYHLDYFKRWQKPGDEKFTNVPAKVPATGPAVMTYSGSIYRYSTALITPGDVIRLQDVSLNYVVPKSFIKRWPVQAIRVYGYARALGILWRANDVGLDPDFPGTTYPEPKSYAAGLQVEF